MPKRVNIVCDCCGDMTGTTEFIERIARAFNVTTDLVHESLYDGKGIGDLPKMTLEGCHAERVS